jgi:peptidoglycan/LPS O-acetylase OafA/YrhL
MKPPKDHLLFLDQLRGLAILAVFAYHALFQAFRRDELAWNGWFRDFHVPTRFLEVYPVTWGWSGVAIFFAISGFCIHLSYSKSNHPSTAEFLIRRFFRIYPPFFAALIFFALIFPHSRVDLHSRFGIAEFLSHLFLAQNLDSRSIHGINVAWWSVAVEFQLYLLYPLLLAGVRRYGWQTVTALTALVEIGMRTAEAARNLSGHPPLPVVWIDSPFYFWFSWTAGALVADAYVNKTRYPFDRRLLPLWICLAVAADFFKPLSYFSFTFVALATCTALVGFLERKRPEANMSPVSPTYLHVVGLCSYSLYLIHQPLVEVVPGIAGKYWPSLYREPMVMFFVSLGSVVLIIPLAWAMYKWIELPGMALGKTAIQYHRQWLAKHANRLEKISNQ